MQSFIFTINFGYTREIKNQMKIKDLATFVSAIERSLVGLEEMNYVLGKNYLTKLALHHKRAGQEKIGSEVR